MNKNNKSTSLLWSTRRYRYFAFNHSFIHSFTMQTPCCVLNYTCMTFSFHKRKNKWRNSCPRKCLCTVACLCSCSSQSLQPRKQRKGRRRNSTWGSLCPWGRWGSKGTGAKGSDLDSKTKKHHRSGVSYFFSFFPSDRLKFPTLLSFLILHRAYHSATTVQVEDLQHTLSRAFSFIRSHHFVGFN